jgi:hypothetical protein
MSDATMINKSKRARTERVCQSQPREYLAS